MSRLQGIGCAEPVERVLLVDYLRRGERYRFVFRAGQRDQVRRLLGRYAADPGLAFNWHDAVQVSSMIKQAEEG